MENIIGFNDDISVENNCFPLGVHRYSLLKHHQDVSYEQKVLLYFSSTVEVV